MKNILKIAVAIVLLLSLAFNLASCINSSLDLKSPELASLVCATAPGAYGYWYNGLSPSDAFIKIIDKDSYGRVLFAYMENNDTPIIVAVMQAKDGEYSYFYPEASTMFIEKPEKYKDLFTKIKRVTEDDFDNTVSSLLTPDMVSELKEQNDWNSPVDLGKTEKTEIVKNISVIYGTNRYGKFTLQEYEYRKILEIIAKDSGYTVYIDYEDSPNGFDSTSMNFYRCQYLYSDDYGRELYYFEGVLTHCTVDYHCNYTLDYLFIFNPDGTYDVDRCYIELADKTDYFARAHGLKKIAEWNTPYEGE